MIDTVDHLRFVRHPKEKKFLIHLLSEWVSEIVTTIEAIASKNQEYHKMLFIDNYGSHKK